MKLQKVIERLQKLHKRKIDLSLDRTFNLLKKLGNPQDKLKNVISVVGTNSKYSMIKSFQSILNQAGYKCNLYTSPHLQSYTERYVYGDKEIDEDNLADLLEYIEKINGSDSLSEFEALTCAYLKYCEEYKDNITFMEAGLFHQYDSCSVFKNNLCTLLGSIAIDHLSWLKNKTIDGIIHEKTTKLLTSKIFVNKQENKETTLKINNSLKNNKSEKYFYGEDFNFLRAENNFIQYEDAKGSLILPEPNILGEHQLANISTSIMAARNIFNIKDEHIKKAVTRVNLKARLQEIKTGKLKKLARNNRLVCDGGHNFSAGLALSKWMNTLDQDINLIVGMMSDKLHKEFMSNFKDKIKSLYLIDIPNQEGSISKEEFKLKIQSDFPEAKLANNIQEAIISITNESQNSYICCIGSFYLVGEILNLN
ncbi:bifunctional folylpolyglutamate synthase/dihydrofolate synthase [Candidatus Pelagibacter sp.]|nr:bifunctional folylpolyglutamate synthase/dihydrofolate synthase [Candidatus Pelagibacter sp.]